MPKSKLAGTKRVRSAGVPARRLALSHRHFVTEIQEKEHEFWQKYGGLICTGILGLLAGVILGKTLWDYNHPQKALLSPLGQTINLMPVEVRAEERYCGDAISYIRCSGEKLGKDNQTIMTMIRIAKAESGLRHNATNPKSTASGVFQILWGTWNSNHCEGNAFDFVNNIDCAWKIQTARGFQPWEVWNKNLIEK